MFDVSETGFLLLLRDDDNDEPDVALIRVFVAFQLLGLFGAVIMLITVLLSPTVQRHPTWHNFTISWIISCISYALLFITGQLYKSTPAFELCFAQTALIYAAPPMTAAATMGLVIQIWFSVRTVIAVPVKNERLWMILIMIFPYFVHLFLVIVALVITIQNPNSIRKVTSSGMYCNSKNPVPGRLSAGLVTVILVSTLVFEILVFRTLRRNWAHFRSRKRALSMIIRVFLFTIFGIFAVALSLLFFFTIHHGSDLNIVLASLPVAAVLIFGTQSDIFKSWMFWRKQDPQEPEQEPPSSDIDKSRWKDLPELPRESVDTVYSQTSKAR